MLSAQLAESLPIEKVTAAPPPIKESSRGLWLSLIGIAAIAAAGIGAGLWLRGQWIAYPDPADGFNVFYVLFSRNEPAGLALLLFFTALTAFWLARGGRVVPRALPLRSGSGIILLALAVFAIAAAGYFIVFHEYSLTADENMADWQARIFLSGRLRAVVPAFWRPFVRLIIPTHASYFPELHSWNSGYLPVYAATRALFMSVELQALVNPFFAGLSVCLIAAIARRLWPNDSMKPLLAAALLGGSSQFLLMSMTAYAMPAHLGLNLLWLWLYLEPRKGRFWLAPFVGVAALGLHQPFFHALFVTPFLARLVWERRWKTSFIFAVIYLAGIVGWLLWWRHFMANFSGAGSRSAFGFHRYTLAIQGIYLCLILGWFALPVPILAALGFGAIRRQPPFLRDAAASCLLTFGFYVFVRFDQAHGWGDRYFHGAIGCFILVALVGWDALAHRIGRQAAATFVVVGLVASFFVQFPLRCFQAEDFVAPYARAAEEFHNSDADLVGFNPFDAWYSADLIRNDPFLKERPFTICIYSMDESEEARLQQKFLRRRLFDRKTLQNLGLATTHYVSRKTDLKKP